MGTVAHKAQVVAVFPHNRHLNHWYEAFFSYSARSCLCTYRTDTVGDRASLGACSVWLNHPMCSPTVATQNIHSYWLLKIVSQDMHWFALFVIAAINGVLRGNYFPEQEEFQSWVTTVWVYEWEIKPGHMPLLNPCRFQTFKHTLFCWLCKVHSMERCCRQLYAHAGRFSFLTLWATWTVSCLGQSRERFACIYTLISKWYVYIHIFVKKSKRCTCLKRHNLSFAFGVPCHVLLCFCKRFDQSLTGSVSFVVDCKLWAGLQPVHDFPLIYNLSNIP